MRVLWCALLLIPLFTLGAATQQAQSSDELDALRGQVAQSFREGKYANALTIQRKITASIEKMETAGAGAPGKWTAEALGYLAYYSLFARDNASALAASKRALVLAPEFVWVETNRAHALLLMRQTAEARAIYRLHKGKRLAEEYDKLWEDGISEDFEELRGAGIVHPAFADILSELGITKAHLNLSKQIASARQQVTQLYDASKYREAEASAQKYAELVKQRFGEQRSEFAGPNIWLGWINEKLNEPAKAEHFYTRALSIYEKALASDRAEMSPVLKNLGELYQNLGRAFEAELVARRARAIDRLTAQTASLGPNHVDVADALGTLAAVYSDLGRYTAAELLFQRAIGIYEKARAPDNIKLADVMLTLGANYSRQGRYAEAETLFQRALTIFETVHGPVHADVASVLSFLGAQRLDQGRFGEAETYFLRSLSIREKVLAADDATLGASFGELGAVRLAQGHYAEAEQALQRCLAITEKALGPDNRSVAVALSNLAGVYRAQGQFDKAEPLFKRMISIDERTLRPDDPDRATSLNNLGLLYRQVGRYGDAESLLQRALVIYENALGDHRLVGIALNNIGMLYLAQGRYADAGSMHSRAIALSEKAVGLDHPDVALSLGLLGVAYQGLGRLSEAEAQFRRALSIYDKALGSDHPDVDAALSSLAGLYFVQRDWERATDIWRRSTAAIVRRMQRGITGASTPRLTGTIKSEAEQQSNQFWSLIKAADRLALSAPHLRPALTREIFTTSQWAQSSQAAASLAQMAARSTKGDAALASVVREQQDLVAEWQKLDGLRTTAVSQPPDKRDIANEAAIVSRLAAIDVRLAEINKRLTKDFPDYAALSQPEPLSVEYVQAQLRPDEALVLLLATPAWGAVPDDVFVWVVTKTDMRWVRSYTSTELARDVGMLRCGLDKAAWEDDGGSKCAGLLGTSADKVLKDNEPLPFDIARAHLLYRVLFGEVEDLIRNKHLLIVLSGPLTQLPLQALVTARPENGDYRSAAWLARSSAITVLPAISSLKTLRRVARPSAATKPMIGFGNPLLDGDPAERPWEAKWVELSREKQACPQTPWQRVAGLIDTRRSVRQVAVRGGHADLDHLRSQVPLHDTADELCAVARELHLAPEDILLGARATEANVKELSNDNSLAAYRVIHFATHGTLAGEIEQTTEPGLILTPPKQQTDTDDGYLSASEVASLKLDADWVILSACNTAAGGADKAEALSGLARAFIYAGARSLLVSHWAVESPTTAKLVASAVGATARDKKLGRAEALRRAMIAMIDQGELHQAHPSYWAPFVVVGEGRHAE